jgi:hypothetical protein
MITVRGFNTSDFKSGDVGVVKEALEFFREEERGKPKITELTLVKALRKLGGDATQVAVAHELDVNPRAIQKWTSRVGLKSWEDVKRRYERTKLW